MGLNVDQVRLRSGVKHSYPAIRLKIFGLTVLPIDDAGFTFPVSQYRYLLDHYFWELPRGSGELDVSQLEAAKRELAEEAGHSAAH